MRRSISSWAAVLVLFGLIACQDRLPMEAGSGPLPPAVDLVAVDGTWLLLTPTALDLGPVVVGGVSASQQALITNVGAASVTLSMAGGAPGFPFVVTQSCQGATLAPGASCSLEAGFSPVAVGPAQATSSFQLNGQLFTLELRGTGLAQPFRVTPAGIDFGEVVVGTTTTTQSAHVTNTGTSPLTIAMAGGAPGSPFLALQNCQGATLLPGASCQVDFSFSPTAEGSATATSSFTLNDRLYMVELRGVGIAAEAARTATFLVNPIGLHFGEVQVGVTSAAQIVSVRNVSASPVQVQMAGGAPGFPFNVVQDCHLQILDPGQACSLQATFDPTAAGPASGASSFTLNGQPFLVALQGTGVPPRLRVSPAGLDFGAVPVGTTSSEQITQITNVGPSPVTIAMAGGAPGAPFTTVQNCHTQTLQPGQSCQLTHTFTPTATGAALGASSFTLNGLPFSVQLEGRGVGAPLLALEFLPPLHADFAVVAGATIPVKFALIREDGARLPDEDGLVLAAACAVTVSFSGAPGEQCASYDAEAYHFQANLRLPRSLGAGSYTIDVKVEATGILLGEGSIGIRVRTPPG